MIDEKKVAELLEKNADLVKSMPKGSLKGFAILVFPDGSPLEIMLLGSDPTDFGRYAAEQIARFQRGLGGGGGVDVPARHLGTMPR